MTPPADVIVLRRTVSGRLFGGFRLQPLLTLMTVLLLARLIGQAIGAIDDPSLPIGGTALVLLAVGAVTALGATGWARADETGITWRYYLHHHVRWEDVREVALSTTGVGITSLLLRVDVRTAHRRLRVTPAMPTTMFGRSPFAHQLLALAAAHGVPTRDEWPRRD